MLAWSILLSLLANLMAEDISPEVETQFKPFTCPNLYLDAGYENTDVLSRVSRLWTKSAQERQRSRMT